MLAIRRATEVHQDPLTDGLSNRGREWFKRYMIHHLSASGRERSSALSGLTAALWLGGIIGVSFIATPVKFQAASLDLPTALDVGRVTFGLFNKVEWGCWLLLAIAVGLERRGWLWVSLGALGVMLVAQTFWLLPVLDVRVERIIDGQPAEPTYHHLAYVALEAAKALVLALVAAGSLRRRVRQGLA